jgi:hypothetical protein
MEMAKHRNVRTGHLHDLGHISVQSNSYFTPRGLVDDLLFFLYFACVFSVLFSFCLFSLFCLFGVDFNKAL